MRLVGLLMSLVLAATATVSAQVPRSKALAPEPAGDVAGLIAPPTPAGSRTLERRDAEAWLDGFMPYALARGNIAGGVVVIVKDGQVLLQKGYGYSDVARRAPVSPERTLFRPGSVSKLLTWTAVMQLVEQGRIDLDADVNQYLEFRIPPYQGRPVTMRNIMTHTAGFEETARHLIHSDPKGVMPLHEFVTRSLPARVFAPGTTPAYSNYATALAGHIVARVSGRSFDDYMDERVFGPIGMKRSSFRQPLPRQLQPLMSKGYRLGTEEPRPYEMVTPAPAGSLAATGADMARFMIAHLDQGRGLLRPDTAKRMHETTLTLLPPLNRMALGFYEQNVNGRRVIGHGGDTELFHSDLALFMDDGVGLYVSLNSSGADGAPRWLREALLKEFGDRYFPASRTDAAIDPGTARAHAQAMAGSYTNSRGSFTNFLRILELFGQAKLGVDEQGRLVAPDVVGTSGQPRRWVEVAPFVWRDAVGGERLAAKVENGRAVRWSFDTVSPFMVFDRTPWYRDSTWLKPAFLGALAVILLTALAWPTGAVARRRYRATLPFTGAALRLHRLKHGFAWLTLIACALWTAFIVIGSEDLSMWAGPLDPLLWTAQILSLVAFFGLLGLAAWNVRLAWKERRGWLSKTWSVLLLVAAGVVLWVGLAFNLIGFGTRY